MPNKGVKAKLGQPISQGRPRGVYKNPAGVPAQQFYKIMRQQARQVNNAKISQVVQQQRQQFRLDHSPRAFEQRASSEGRAIELSDWGGGDF